MRADPTFSGLDLIRIWTENLTAKEQEDVRCFFLVLERTRRDVPRAIRLLLRLFILIAPQLKKVFPIIEDAIKSIQDAEDAAECLRRVTRRPESEVM